MTRIGQWALTLVVIDRKPSDGVDVMFRVWRRSLLLFGMLVALSAGDVAAKECLGINFPEQARADASTLTLNGLGVRKATLMKINVYIAALYVANPSSDPNAILGSKAPIKLILHFVRDVGAADISNGFDEGFARSAKGQLSALRERIAMLNGWMTDLKSGQQMTFLPPRCLAWAVTIAPACQPMFFGSAERRFSVPA